MKSSNRYDVVIVGGGLSGLVSGIALSQSGKRVALIGSGRNSLNYFSGSLELFAEGVEALDGLTEVGGVRHPYQIIGRERVERYEAVVKSIFAEAGVPLVGTAHSSHCRLTPIGELKPAWLTLEGFATPMVNGELEYRSVCVVGIEGYLDFNPEFVARAFAHRGAECHTISVALPESVGVKIRESIASPEVVEHLATELSQRVEGADVVLLPAIFDLWCSRVTERLSAALGVRVELVPVAAASMVGADVQKALQRRFEKLGGRVVESRATRANVENNRVTAVVCSNDELFEADNFVLATGSFFGGGLASSFERIYEPLLGVSVTDQTPREEWYSSGVFDAQPYQRFGVVVDDALHPQLEGGTVANLYVVGALLAGTDGVKEGCGGGVAVCSALMAAEEIAGAHRECE